MTRTSTARISNRLRSKVGFHGFLHSLLNVIGSDLNFWKGRSEACAPNAHPDAPCSANRSGRRRRSWIRLQSVVEKNYAVLCDVVRQSIYVTTLSLEDAYPHRGNLDWKAQISNSLPHPAWSVDAARDIIIQQDADIPVAILVMISTRSAAEQDHLLDRREISKQVNRGTERSFISSDAINASHVTIIQHPQIPCISLPARGSGSQCRPIRGSPPVAFMTRREQASA